MVDKFHGTALALQFDALDPKRRASVVGARDAYERSVRDVIADGIAKKVFRPVNPKLAGQFHEAWMMPWALGYSTRTDASSPPSTPPRA